MVCIEPKLTSNTNFLLLPFSCYNNGRQNAFVYEPVVFFSWPIWRPYNKVTNMSKLVQMICHVRFGKSPVLYNVGYSQAMIYLDRYQSQHAYAIPEKSKTSQTCLTISH